MARTLAGGRPICIISVLTFHSTARQADAAAIQIGRGGPAGSRLRAWECATAGIYGRRRLAIIAELCASEPWAREMRVSGWNFRVEIGFDSF